MSVESRHYSASWRLLKTQWAIGPLSSHRICCRMSSEQRLPFNEADPDAQFKLWHRASGELRCKSVSCRPGDPFGCSMTRARTYRDRTQLILGGWLRRGHHAYLARLETRGAADEPLDLVLSDAQSGVRAAFIGKYRSTQGIVGKIDAVNVTRTSSDEWIVRRWALMCGTRELDAAAREILEDGIRRRFERAVSRGSVIGVHQLSGSFNEIMAVSQLMTGCRSRLDPDPDEIFTEALDLKFKTGDYADDDEIDIPTMASTYRSHFIDLKSRFAEGRPGDQLAAFEGEYRLHRPAGDRREVIRLRVPATAKPFMEYSLAMQGVNTWNAHPVRSAAASTPIWNALVSESQGIKSSYMPYEVSIEGRSSRV